MECVASTESAAVAVMLDEAWDLSPSVELRPEPFGALAYHFGNRKLVFLKRPQLVAVIVSLTDQPDVRSALTQAGVHGSQHSAYVEALRGLAATDIIRPRIADVEKVST